MADGVQAVLRRAPALAVVLLVLAPASGAAHSLVRLSGSEAIYVSQDATSLNTLTIRPVGAELEFRDPTVDGGADPGPCRPGNTSDDGNFWIVQVFCRRAGIARVRVDLGEREDKATVAAGVPSTVLGGPGADRLTTGDAADTVDGGEGNDILAAGGGPDTMAGGLGVDSVDAGPGDDRLTVRDGLPDSVRCGEGSDRVDADTLDEVAGDCEGVTRTPTAPPPESGTTGTDRVAPVVDVGAATLQSLGRRGIVRVAATSSERGTIGASGFIDVAGLSLPLRSANERVAVAGAGVELAIRLTRRQLREARRALGRRRRVVVRLGVVATDAAGNSAERRAPWIRISR